MKLSAEDSRTAVAAVERAYHEIRAAGAATGWLAPVRDDALSAFARAGFPTTRHEDWKYTDLARLAKTGGELLGRAPEAADPEVVETLLSGLPREPGDHMLVFVNGSYSTTLSALPDPAAGIRLTMLAGADEKDRARLAEWLGRASRAEEHGFAALNAAFANDAVIVDIAADASPGASLHVVFVTDGQPIGTQPRLLVDAGERSTARLFEHHVGRGPGWTNAITDIRCGKSSKLTYVKLQDEGHETDHIAAQHVSLDADSIFRALHVDLGARLARNDLRVSMDGRAARAELFGLFLVDGERHVDNHTRTDHIVGHTVSHEHYRGIMNERGRGVFNGKIIVHEGADGTDAKLNNRNLLLAKTAEIDTKPELEIYTDDVKCAHGATTGQLDEQALFYLRARGIPLEVARHMLVLAFAREIFEQFDPAATGLGDHINRTLKRRLPE